MKKLFGYVFIVLSIVIFFRPFLFNGLLPIPSDTIIGLYHPFRDMYAPLYPRGVPFKNFLITDPVRQLIPWKSLAIQQEKKLQFPLWNPYSFAGSPLLANFQTGAFYPLNIVFFLLPFSLAWSIFIILQPILGGIFLYWYLRSLKLHPIAATIGSISFIFSGFAISWLEWGNIFATILWLPLILLAKDKLIMRWTIFWTCTFFFAETASFFAGHLQLWFYMWFVTNTYLFLRVYQKTVIENKKRFLWRYIKNYFPFLMVGIVMYAVTIIQSFPTIQFILHSARSVDQNYLITEGWFMPYQNLLQFIVPDFFGNPATLNYWGVWNYAEFVGYIGILPLLFVIFALAFRHDKKTWFFGAIALIALLFALPTPIGTLPFQLNIPFLSTSQPTRLMGVVDLALSILAALGADLYIRKKNSRMVWICGLFGFMFVVLWIIAMKVHMGISSDHIAIIKRNLVFPSLFLFVSALMLVSGVFLRFKRWLLFFGLLSVVIVGVDLLRFGDKFTPFTSPAYLFPQEKTLRFLQQHIDNQRMMTTDSRIFAPNFSIQYKLQSVDGYDPLYLQNYAELIAASERDKADIHSPFGFNRIITPHNYNSRIVDLLGVKYILSLEDLNIQKLKKVFQERETRVYENTEVLPRAFFVKNLVLVQSKQDAISQLFKIKNLHDTAVIIKSQKADSLSVGNVAIVLYTPNSVVLQTNNSGDGFVVLTDIDYPTWHAAIDGEDSPIHTTDFAFRGIFVPKGRHTIVFSDRLF